MSATQGSGSDAKLWIMPVVLELFAFPFAWISVQMLHDHEPWRAIAEYALTGIILCIAGVVWAVFRKHIAEIWPWNKLRKKEAELAKVLQDNSELRVNSGLDKPQHNVQCTGFKVFTDDDFIIAALCFRNVPNGKLLGKFGLPRLRVIYYKQSTGEEIADKCPIVWQSESGNNPIEIDATEQYAKVASFFKGTRKWTATELNEPSEDFDSWHQLNSIDLPAGGVHVIARLAGAYKLHVPPVEGILTLGEDGSASFKPTKGYIEAI